MSDAARAARTVSSMRVAALLAVYLAALGVLVGACGGGSAAAGLGAGAEIAPASTAVFVSIRTDFDEEGWQLAREHAAKFPAVEGALADLHRELEDEGLDFERDVRPALGPELALAVQDVEAKDGGFVALTQPSDEAELEELVAKADHLTYKMVEDGWALLAASKGAIAKFEAAAEDASLAESDGWEQATDGLPDDALVAGYVNGSALTREIDMDASDADGFGAVLGAFLPGGRVPSVGFAVSAEDEGVRVDAASTMDGEGFEEYEASLPGEVPAGALAFVSWQDAAEHLRGALRRAGDADPEIDRYIAQAELGLGISLERDVLPLLEGEGALVVYPPEAAGGEAGAGWPGGPTAALVLEVEDEEEAVATLDRIVDRASELLGSIERTEDVEVEGVPARSVSLEGFDLLYAAFDGKLVVSTSSEAIAGIAGDGDKLGDEEAFTGAREAAEAPDETAGFAFVDLNAVAEAYPSDAPADFGRNLEPLDSLFVFGVAEDDEVAVEGFLDLE